MSENYRRLCAADRKVIQILIQAGSTQKEIGQAVGVGQSAISKEISRNGGAKGYSHIRAERLARARQREKKPRAKVMVGATKEIVEERLRAKHSPDQIRRKLKLEGISISHESIYRHVARDKKDGGELWRELRINGKRR